MIEFINHSVKAWAEIFGLAVLQNTLFLGLLFYALHQFRNGTARIKYWTAMIALFKLLLPPFIPAPFVSRFLSFSNNLVGIDFGEPAVITASDTTGSSANLSLLGLLFLIWMFTAVLSLLIPIIATIRLKWKLRLAVPLAGFQKNLAGQAVNIYCSDKIAMPLTMGIFSPKIFVPTQWESWSPSCRHMILQHELAHIQRRDSLAQMLQILIQAVYFFHPLVWILNARLNQYREMACDDMSVTAKRNSAMEYSRYLVKIAEELTLSELGCSSASALIRQRNELLNRVQYQIMEVTMKHISKKKLGGIISILLFSFMLLSFSFSSSPTDNPGNFAVQTAGKIIGEVKDKKTREPLPAVNIFIEGTKLGAASDKDGKFSINDVPPGAYNLRAEMIGFKTIAISFVKVEVGKIITVNFFLERSVEGLKKVEERQVPPPPDKGIELKQKLQKGVEIPRPPKEKLVTGVEIPLPLKEKLVTGVKIPPPPKEKLVTVEEKQHGNEKSFTIKEKQQGEIPPLPVSDKEKLADYDTPPEVVGGFGELAKAIKYPESARKAGITGTVHIGIQIDERGKVLEAKILESLTADCDQAAIEALKSVQWKPAMKDEKPVKVWVTVPVKFNLK